MQKPKLHVDNVKTTRDITEAGHEMNRQRLYDWNSPTEMRSDETRKQVAKGGGDKKDQVETTIKHITGM